MMCNVKEGMICNTQIMIQMAKKRIRKILNFKGFSTPFKRYYVCVRLGGSAAVGKALA
jgi:hypothetical protein